MMVHQTAEKLALIDVLDSSPKKYSASQEWVQGSGVSEDITKLNLQPLIDRAVIAMKLGWKKYLDNLPLGWWVSGLNLRTMQLETFGQFKPNDPVKLSAKDKDGAKYLTSKGEYDAIALQHPDKDYWQRVIDDPSIPIALDEGVKKAGLLMTLGFIALALCGVTMGLKKGGKELVNNLAVLAVQGRPITIVFDSDLAVKPSIQLALKALATVLKQKGCIVSVAIIPLELESKGIYDVWAKHGEEMVKKIMADAIPYAQWLKNLEVQMSESAADGGNKKSNPKPPTPRETAVEIAEEFGHQWKFDNEQKEWRVYSGKHWEKVEIGNFETLLMRVIDSKNINYKGNAYLIDVQSLLTKLLREKKWGGADKTRFINFSNCVLDGKDGTTRKHEASDGFTSYLPYEYKPLTGNTSNALQALEKNCPNISHWMKTAMRGDAKKMFKLLAIINGCLRFGFHGWQMFVHLIGDPGSGKGTFARLLEKLVGKENSQPCSLDQLKDGSTLASIIDKQLVVFGDERKPVGVDSILRLTGGDNINYREVYRPAANAYFYGLLLICSNDPIFMGNTTGLERRLCLVEFNNPIPKALRNSEMEASFDSEIASLIAIALSLPSHEVKQAVQGIGDAEIADFKAAEWEMKVRMDSLAAFFEMELIVEDGAQIRAGDLFNHYKDFCEEIKKPAMSLTTFSPGLEKLCTELHQPVIRDRSGRHVTFIGLRLRRDENEHPTYSQKLAVIAGLDTPNAGLDPRLDAGLATVQGKGLQELQDLTLNILENYQISEKQPSAIETVEVKKEVTPPSPAAPVKPLPSKVPSAAQSPVKASKTPAQSPATKHHHKEFKVGDRVRILDSGLHHGQDGQVIHVGFGSVENDYVIALDKESHLCRLAIVTVPHSQKFPILMAEPKNV